MTVAIATGFAIAHSRKALRAWELRRARRHGGVSQDRAAYRASLARLATFFPANVKVH